jgi:hypothetical protein
MSRPSPCPDVRLCCRPSSTLASCQSADEEASNLYFAGRAPLQSGHIVEMGMKASPPKASPSAQDQYGNYTSEDPTPSSFPPRQPPPRPVCRRSGTVDFTHRAMCSGEARWFHVPCPRCHQRRLGPAAFLFIALPHAFMHASSPLLSSPSPRSRHGRRFSH